jgi:hypothetical protein
MTVKKNVIPSDPFDHAQGKLRERGIPMENQRERTFLGKMNG